MHYYTHHIADFRKDTGHLSMLEQGAYRLLLETYYLSEEPISADDAKVMRTHSARTADEMQAIRNVLNDFFVLTVSGWVHKRCELEITKYHAKSEGAANAAKARWAKVLQEKNANGMRTHSERNANGMLTNNQEPITNNQEPSFKNTCHETAPKKQKKEPSGYSPDFLIFWNLYPERPGASKAAAYKAWQARIKAGADTADILSGTKRYADYIAKNQTEPQYIKQPSTFLGPDLHYQSAWAEPAKQFPQLSKAGSATALAAQEFLKSQAEKRAREAEKNA